MKVLVSQSRDVRRWDTKFFAQPRLDLPAADLVRFGDVTTRRLEPLDRARPDIEQIPIGSIHFDGSMTLRGVSPLDLKGQMFLAHANDVVFSKIDVRNGAIAVVPEPYERLAFTTEYPVYDTEGRARLRPMFARLLFQTVLFKALVNALVVGHSGRKRVSPELMEDLVIPVPGFDRQDAILAHFRALTAQSLAAGVEADRLEGSPSDRHPHDGRDCDRGGAA